MVMTGRDLYEKLYPYSSLKWDDLYPREKASWDAQAQLEELGLRGSRLSREENLL